MHLFTKHKQTLHKAMEALHARTFYSSFAENPSPSNYGETADADGMAKFKNQLGKKFQELTQEEPCGWIGDEESPYTQESLRITYPHFSVDSLISSSSKAQFHWSRIKTDVRAGVLLESLDRIKTRFYEIAYATMHTTGQGFMMAFQASGPHAADRALESIAAGYQELTRFPAFAVWDKPVGKFNVRLNKEWRAIPKGISVVIGCSTFPTWNSVTGIYGSLITGNTVIVKPHPGSVLPIAIIVAEIQKTLVENDLDPNTCQLAVDSFDQMITKELVEHEDVKLIDYTGNSEFGSYLESLPFKTVFTEKAGVNSVILDSVEDAEKVAANLAFSINLYSGQMCTAPQNFFIPADGVRTPNGKISFDDFAQKIIAHINAMIDNPKAGPFVLGAIQNKKTLDRIRQASQLSSKVLLLSRSFENPMFKNARLATPMVIETDSSAKEIFSKEVFGPVVFFIKTKDIIESITLAKEIAAKHGAISCGAYTTSSTMKELIADEMSSAGTAVSFNLTGAVYLNQNAAFSDFHATGGNPSANASFTNPEYIAKRFVWVGFREPVADVHKLNVL